MSSEASNKRKICKCFPSQLKNTICLDFSNYHKNYGTSPYEMHDVIKIVFKFKVEDVYSMEIVKSDVFISFATRDIFEQIISSIKAERYIYHPQSGTIPLCVPGYTVIKLHNAIKYCKHDKTSIIQELKKYGDVQSEDIFLSKWPEELAYPVINGVTVIMKVVKELPPNLVIDGVTFPIEVFNSGGQPNMK